MVRVALEGAPPTPPPPSLSLSGRLARLARGCGECDVLWQASPASRPADLVLRSSGSAPTSCIMSRAVRRCPCVSDTVARCGTCSSCRCLRVSADTPLTALRRAPAPPVRAMNQHGCVGMRACARAVSVRVGRPGSVVPL